MIKEIKLLWKEYFDRQKKKQFNHLVSITIFTIFMVILLIPEQIYNNYTWSPPK